MDFDEILPSGIDGADIDTAFGRSNIGLALRELLGGHSGAVNDLTLDERLELVEKLPRLTEDELPDKDDSCSICFTPWLAIMAEEETIMALDSPAYPIEYTGVTRLSGEGQCNHYFCRRDICKWIEQSHNSCPLCRQPLVKRPDTSTANTTSQAESNGPMQNTVESILNDTANATNDSRSAATRFRDAIERILPSLVQAQGRTNESEEEEQDLHNVLELLSSALGEEGPQVPPALRNLGPFSFFGFPSATGRTERNQDDDRHEFAGMYS